MGFSSDLDNDFHYPFHSHEDHFGSHEDTDLQFHDDDHGSSFRMDIFIPIVVCFVIFLLCTLCGVCCRKKRNAGAIFSSPVIVTSSTHTTAAGPYPVTVAVPAATIQQTAAPYGQPGVYPMPQTGYSAPYPPAQTQQAAAPYPPASGAGSSMPMPGNPTGMNPPSYDQVVGNDAYQKQSPYNPSYGGN
ncbi:protein shisa-5 isoform X1 [Phlebotomus argentipes]|uniref:protein shisa-5 isoform X1 n=1 Tax=Phlebotomus argentipes TaxID=94469 RepID=UPI00289367DC|nr:protein shisa-5 isoform X1 [Phlebotomus argentipes]